MENKTKEAVLCYSEDLNKVPGFSPVDFFTEKYDENGELIGVVPDASVQRTWFRLKNPRGAVRKKSWIEETGGAKIAWGQCEIFLDIADPMPAASERTYMLVTENANVVADRTSAEIVPHFLVSVEGLAELKALRNLGFGVQFKTIKTKEDKVEDEYNEALSIRPVGRPEPKTATAPREKTQEERREEAESFFEKAFEKSTNVSTASAGVFKKSEGETAKAPAPAAVPRVSLEELVSASIEQEEAEEAARNESSGAQIPEDFMNKPVEPDYPSPASDAPKKRHRRTKAEIEADKAAAEAETKAKEAPATTEAPEAAAMSVEEARDVIFTGGHAKYEGKTLGELMDNINSEKYIPYICSGRVKNAPQNVVDAAKVLCSQNPEWVALAEKYRATIPS